MEFIIVTGVISVRVLNLLDANFLSTIWSYAQGRSSHFGSRYRKYLFDKIRTSRALKVISSFVKPGGKKCSCHWQWKDCYYSVTAVKITAVIWSSGLEQFAILCGKLYHPHKTSSNHSQCFIHACVFNTVENIIKLLSYKLIRVPQIKGVRTWGDLECCKRLWHILLLLSFCC